MGSLKANYNSSKNNKISIKKQIYNGKISFNRKIPSSLITNGLVFHVDPSNTSCYSGSGSTCNDLTSLNGQGTLTNIAFSEDKAFQMLTPNSSSIQFSRGYTNVPNEHTFMITIFLPTVSLTDSYFLSSLNLFGGGLAIGISLVIDNYAFEWYGASDNGFGSYFSFYQEKIDATPIINTKSILCGTVNGNIIKFYLNGNFIGTTLKNSTENINIQSTINIGYEPNLDLVVQPNTKIYNSLIYNRALSDAEVLQNYNYLKLRYNL